MGARLLLLAATVVSGIIAGIARADEPMVTWAEIVEQTLGPDYDLLNDPLPDDVEKLQVLAKELRNIILMQEATPLDANAEQPESSSGSYAAYFEPQDFPAVYHLRFTSRGEITRFYWDYEATFETAEECWNHINNHMIPKWKSSTYRHSTAWVIKTTRS